MDARLGGEMRAFAPLRLYATDPDDLVRTHLGLVRKLAWQVHSRMSSAIDVEDLIQIGTIALIEAARNFEDRGQAMFATYATVRVRGGMIDALRRSATMVRSAIRHRREFVAVRGALERGLGRRATDDEMAKRLDLSVEAFRLAVAATHGVRHESIDEVYSDHNASFADTTPDAFDDLTRARLKAALSAAIVALPGRQALVLQLYYVDELNLEEIGLTLEVGAARVCQIKKAALARIRATLVGWDN